MTPDQVCANRPDDVKIFIRSLKEDRSCVLIEADARGFRFLSELFAAQASADHCGFQIGPAGAGSAAFAPDSQLGLYLHRVPCDMP